jgi:phospholipid-binding lipoprotein MlaA
MQNANYYKLLLGQLLLLWVVSGCATTTTANPDPFESFNRAVFAFNDGLDKTMVKPLAKVYQTIVPPPVDKGVSNFFSNLDDVVVIANDLLQFKFKQAASDTGRVLLNSTVGLLGFVDVASKFNLPKHDEDFGQTLGYWGIGSGPYLVLPILGPSSGRDALGQGADAFLDPLSYYAGSDFDVEALAPYAVKGIDGRADLLEAEKILDEAALDKYSYMRDAYLARREYLVYDGNPPSPPEEDGLFDGDDDELFDDLEDDELSADLDESAD